MLNFVYTVFYTKALYAQCHYAECYYAECHCAEIKALHFKLSTKMQTEGPIHLGSLVSMVTNIIHTIVCGAAKGAKVSKATVNIVENLSGVVVVSGYGD